MTNETHLSIPLSGISLQLDDKTTHVNNSGASSALLDTGTSFTYLPETAFNAVINTLGATYNADYGVYFVPNITDKTLSLAFNFTGAQIVVPAVEYILLSDTSPPMRPYSLHSEHFQEH